MKNLHTYYTVKYVCVKKKYTGIESFYVYTLYLNFIDVYIECSWK